MTDRRRFLAASAALFAGGVRADDRQKRRLGVVIHSYPIRSREKGFSDPSKFLDFCRERGAAGVQLPLGTRPADEARQLRALAEKHGMYLEGSVRPPKDKADVDRFGTEIKTAHECGATVVRTVMLGGRRYETFRTAKEYAAFADGALASLRLAEPVVARQKVTLAVENHKDFRTDELVGVMKLVSSEYVGVCVDTGNNLALLEVPQDTAAALAPWAVACHLKDMGVEESSDGFLLAEVQLGDGCLDLKGIAEALRNTSAAAAQPGDDYPRPAPHSVPDRGLLGHAGKSAGERPGPRPRPGEETRLEGPAPADQQARGGGPAGGRGRERPAVAGVRPDPPGIVRTAVTFPRPRILR